MMRCFNARHGSRFRGLCRRQSDASREVQTDPNHGCCSPHSRTSPFDSTLYPPQLRASAEEHPSIITTLRAVPRRASIGPKASLGPCLRHFADAYDLRIRAKFFVVAVGHVRVHIEILQQCHTDVYFYGFVLRQPDFIVDTRLLGDDASAFMKPGKEEAEGDGVKELRIQFDPLALGFINPDASAHLG